MGRTDLWSPWATNVAVCSCNLGALVAEDQAKLVIRLDSSRRSAAGAATAYLLRRLAARAGAYAPGIHEFLFNEIAHSYGTSLDRVEKWLHIQSEKFAALGYQIRSRRTAAPAGDVLAWVNEGNGFRASILIVDGTQLYSKSDPSVTHAVALIYNDPTSGIGDQNLERGLVMIDPWPGLDKFSAVPDGKLLDAAHRVNKYDALLLFWTGHS